MSDHKITPIGAGVVMSEGKQQLLDHIAQTYDRIAADGAPPVALVFGLVTEFGGCDTGYYTMSPIEDRNTLYISRAVMCLVSDYKGWTQR